MQTNKSKFFLKKSGNLKGTYLAGYVLFFYFSAKSIFITNFPIDNQKGVVRFWLKLNGRQTASEQIPSANY